MTGCCTIYIMQTQDYSYHRVLWKDMDDGMSVLYGFTYFFHTEHLFLFI